jgi:hypothetical protein
MASMIDIAIGIAGLGIAAIGIALAAIPVRRDRLKRNETGAFYQHWKKVSAEQMEAARGISWYGCKFKDS